MAITAKLPRFDHADVMQRELDEVDYVLTVLLRMRDQVSAKAELYDPDAKERIDEAIARLDKVRRETELIVCNVEQPSKAA